MCASQKAGLLFSAELKPCELFWQADLGYIGQAVIGVKVPNSSLVASIRHLRVMGQGEPGSNLRPQVLINSAILSTTRNGRKYPV